MPSVIIILRRPTSWDFLVGLTLGATEWKYDESLTSFCNLDSIGSKLYQSLEMEFSSFRVIINTVSEETAYFMGPGGADLHLANASSNQEIGVKYVQIGSVRSHLP